MPALEPRTRACRFRADVAAPEVAGLGRIQQCADVGRRYMPALNIVHPLIVALGHDRQRHVGPDADVGMFSDQPRHDAVVDAADVQRVRQDDRRLEKARLVDPMRAGQLAVAVQIVRRGGNPVDPCIVVGDDSGRPGPHRTDARDQRPVALDLGDLADPYAGYVRDSVDGSRRERSHVDGRASVGPGCSPDNEGDCECSSSANRWATVK